MRNYYKVLEVAEFASLKQIHSAYRRLAKHYHPDVNPHYELAAEMFKLVNEAYGVLSDAQKKMAYDSLLRQANIEADCFRPETADGAAHSAAENKGNDHLTNGKCDVDDWFFANFGHLDNACYSCEKDARNRMRLFLNIVYFMDICLLGYFIYRMLTIDLSIAPKANSIAATWYSWQIGFKACIVIQKLSLCLSFFMLLMSLLQNTSICPSIFNRFTARGLYPWMPLIFAHFLIKAMLAFCCIAVYLGMSLLDLPNGIFIYAFLWHFLMCGVLFVWLLDWNTLE